MKHPIRMFFALIAVLAVAWACSDTPAPTELEAPVAMDECQDPDPQACGGGSGGGSVLVWAVNGLYIYQGGLGIQCTVQANQYVDSFSCSAPGFTPGYDGPGTMGSMFLYGDGCEVPGGTVQVTGTATKSGFGSHSKTANVSVSCNPV